MNPNRHIYLYAKNWYMRTNIMEDLRIIISRGGVESPTPEIIIQELIGIVRSHGVDLIRGNSPEETIIKCLGILSSTQLKDIEGDIGFPDETLLRLSYYKNYRRFKKNEKD